jgi:C_GCAxxG_C_C family probable redox protein
MPTIKQERIVEMAANNFNSGWYCAESVVLSLTKAYGIESELSPKAATAFCSGMSRTCGTCGALTGAVMGISTVLGRGNAEASVEEVYKATATLVDRFENEFGSRNCHELLGCDLATQEGQNSFRENELYKRCRRYTLKAAEFAGEILQDRSP